MNYAVQSFGVNGLSLFLDEGKCSPREISMVASEWVAELEYDFSSPQCLTVHKDLIPSATYTKALRKKKNTRKSVLYSVLHLL